MRKLRIEFYERQSKKQWWVWVILIGIDLLFIFGCIQQLIFDNPFGNNPISDVGLLIVTILIFLFSVLMIFVLSLHTYINNEGVFVKYFPFQFRYKFYDWNTIRASYIRKYNPISESSGWGISLGNNATKAYTMSGNMGLQLVLRSGKKILIGTNEPDYLETVLMKLDKMERMKDG
jgi:hypothetical protein